MQTVPVNGDVRFGKHGKAIQAGSGRFDVGESTGSFFPSSFVA
jgi:hypothetical protein